MLRPDLSRRHHLDHRYAPGRRSAQWRKHKFRRAEAFTVTGAVTNVDVLRGMLDRAGADQRSFSPEELRDVEEELLASAVAAAPPDQPLPDSNTATLALCGARAPIADHLRQQAGSSELRPARRQSTTRIPKRNVLVYIIGVPLTHIAEHSALRR